VRAKTISGAVTEAESRLMRSVATGRSNEGVVTVQLGGNGKVKGVELDHEALGISEELAAKIGDAFKEATEAALAKQGRRVRRELQQLG
jgi:DNA-binding protein YbaB